jgi:hypothetical protein
MAALSRWLASPAEVENHAIRVRPEIHHRTDELRAVVVVDALWQSPIEPQPLERGRDILPGQAPSDGDVETLAGIQIQHGQRPEFPPVHELVGDEVHAPDVVAGGRWSSLFPMHGGRVPPRPFAP